MFFLNILCNWKHVSINSSKEKIVLLHDSKELIMQRFKFLINIESTWKCGINEQTPQLTLQWQYCHKQPPEVFYKKVVLRNFTIFTGKHKCGGFFLIKLQAFRSATFLKRDSNTGVSCGYSKIFQIRYFVILKNIRQCFTSVNEIVT